jgi:hypothetical protein
MSPNQKRDDDAKRRNDRRAHVAPSTAAAVGSEPMSTPERSPVVEEVLRFEDLPLGSRGTRRAVVRWSDGSEGALTWYADLCGHPHKSAYAEASVMPTTARNRCHVADERSGTSS